MEYVKALDTAELPAGKMAMVVVGGTEVLLVNVAGSYYAIANRCNHAGGSLVNGKLEASTVTCPRHGTQYDVRTGRRVQDGKIAFFKVNAKDQVPFEVKVEGTTIMIGKP